VVDRRLWALKFRPPSRILQRNDRNGTREEGGLNGGLGIEIEPRASTASQREKLALRSGRRLAMRGVRRGTLMGRQETAAHFEKSRVADVSPLKVHIGIQFDKEKEMSRKKVTVVGGGFVGSTTAQRIVDLELADVVLTDILDGPPAGKALDMVESGPITRTDASATGISTGTGDYSATAGSDVVVITAGFPRKPGMSRDDLLKANYDVVKAVVEQIVKYSPNCILVVVTNPLDAMAQAALKVSGFPKNRVIGMAGVLDSARMSSFVAMECKVSVENVHSFVLGGHGDDMVPLPRYSTVAGIPLPDLLPKEKIDAIVERTRKGGAEIVNLLKTGSAYYAPSAAAVEMVEAILKDKKKILPCAVYLEGEYGIKGLFVGVPVKLGTKGAEEIIQIKLTAEENAALQKSAASVKELVGVLGL
jgi:malate dehydrogenase